MPPPRPAQHNNDGFKTFRQQRQNTNHEPADGSTRHERRAHICLLSGNNNSKHVRVSACLTVTVIRLLHVKPSPHQHQCRTNTKNGNNVKRVYRKISSFQQSGNKLNTFNLFPLCRKDEISFDIVAEIGNNVEHSILSTESFDL